MLGGGLQRPVGEIKATLYVMLLQMESIVGVFVKTGGILPADTNTLLDFTMAFRTSHIGTKF